MVSGWRRLIYVGLAEERRGKANVLTDPQAVSVRDGDKLYERRARLTGQPCDLARGV